MKTILISLISLMLIVSPEVGWTRLVESDTSVGSRPSLFQSFVSRVKTKVSSWWSPSSTQPSQRELASSQPVSPSVTSNSVPQAPQEKMALMPKYNTQSQRSELNQMTKTDLAKVKEVKLLNVSKSAIAADSRLQKNKQGVPTFLLKRAETKTLKDGRKKTVYFDVTEIPALSVGQEESVVANEFSITKFEIKKFDFDVVNPLPTPPVATEDSIVVAMGAPVEKVTNAKGLKVSLFDKDGRVSLETVAKVKYQIENDAAVVLQDVKLMSDEELRFLKALILVSSADRCHVAAGLLAQLSDSQDSKIASESNFYLAICLHQMGLFHESVRRIKIVLQSSRTDHISKVVTELARELPREYITDIGNELKKTDVAMIPQSAMDGYHYLIAKSAAMQEHFNSAFEHAAKVSIQYDKYPEAQYLMAVSEHVLGKTKSSLERQRKLQEHLAKNGSKDKMLPSLISLNLARMAFQEKKYAESIQSFNEIRKDNPLWVQALIEQGWAQLMNNDTAGAIGNMYSIHSPYFKSVYQPESFVVRTIGYINICQFGDAYRTLTTLENQYDGWKRQITSYRNKAKPGDYYKSMVTYLRSPSQQGVDGLPFQVLREMGRHRDFLNLQEAVNRSVDEVEQYKFVQSLINRDRSKANIRIKDAYSRAAQLNVEIKNQEMGTAKKAQSVSDLRDKRNSEERLVARLKFEIEVLDESQKLLNSFQKIAIKKLSDNKVRLQAAADGVLKSRLKKMEQRLVSILDNNELLRYEVFAGSGENIRYQAAGGESQSGKRISADVKPKSKALQWEFDGEFWEDEIGHYRSSLKDNCPQTRSASR